VSTLAPPPPAAATPPTQPPSPNSQGGLGLRLKRAVAATLGGRAVLRPVSALLRADAPILKLGKRVVVSRHADVLEVLTRDTDFTIHEVNGPSIDRISGPFILEMDRGPIYDRDHAALREAARYDDLPRARALVRDSAARLVDAARPHGRIEAVQGLTRLVATELVARYFGFPGPDTATVQRWLRTLFQEAFANPIADPFVLQAALRSRAEVEAWLPGELARRRAAGVADADDVLGRMLAMQGPERPWLDDDWVRRNICGLVVGAVDTTSRFSVLALDELLRRPAELAGAAAAAHSGDMAAVRQYAWEAVRFNPHTPLMTRFCPRDTVLAAGTPRERKVAAGSTMFVLTLAASFDAAAVPEPARFRTDRDIRSYLHFGWGMHQCFGLALNCETIPEIVASLLRLPNLRRAPGAPGHVTLDGPFPDRWELEFG
jgi:cytochrome P450